jgi:propionate catabolism operon transcriptional regulator
MFSRTHGNTWSFCDKCLELLNEYQWPGNVRELMNFVERYVAINKKLRMKPLEYTKEYLRQVETANEQKDEKAFNKIVVSLDTYKAMEKQLLQEALNRFGGNKRQTAIALGISRTSLWKKISE